MKLASYVAGGRASFGIVAPGGLIDLRRRMGVESLREFLAGNSLARAAQVAGASVDYAFDEVTLLPVIPDPAHCWCVGTNYADHLREVQDAGINRPAPTHPPLFIRYPATFVPHGAPLLVPVVSDRLDFEAELAVIIGKGGRYVEETEAMSHVAGYACFNDGSIRDWQFHSTQVTCGKNFVGTGGFGPWLVTADEIENPHDLPISLTINGTTYQDGTTRDLIFAVPRIVSYVSAMLPLEPGDVIATGTPAGVGFSRKPPVFLRPGDVCEVTIGNIGTLHNTVAAAR
ncbi:MAG: fumarylacetoacetate hydrolase family protein [Hyphomicrobiaceae bacterium]